MSSLRDYLNDILQYANDIADFTQTGETAFNTDRKTQLAVMRAYEVIGEIVKRLPQTLLDTQPDIDWRAIKAFAMSSFISTITWTSRLCGTR